MRIVFSSLSDRFRHSSVSVSSVGTPSTHLRRGSACASLRGSAAGVRGGTRRPQRTAADTCGCATYSASLHLRRDLSCGFDDLRRQLSAWAPRVLVFPPLARPCRRSDTHPVTSLTILSIGRRLAPRARARDWTGCRLGGCSLQARGCSNVCKLGDRRVTSRTGRLKRHCFEPKPAGPPRAPAGVRADSSPGHVVPRVRGCGGAL